MKKSHKISFGLLGFVATLLFVFQIGVPYIQRSIAAASNTARFSLNPSGGNLTVGSTVSIQVRVSLDNNYNAASTDLYYNSSRLQYLSGSISSTYNGGGNTNQSSNGFGSYIAVYGSRNSGGSINGSSTLATLRFRVKSAGSAYANFGSRRVVLYPTTEYATTATNASYTAKNPPAPNPPPSPTPTKPTPKPTPRPTPRPTQRPAPRATASAPAQSQPSSSGLKITNFKISQLDYRSALLTWTTNKPSTTKANYSTLKDDLYLQQKDDKKVTSHSLRLNNEEIRAGRKYFVRITSDDGKGATTIDGTFETKRIPVIVTVNDQDNKPVAEAVVSADSQVQITDENGEAQLALPEGDGTIFAEKDTLSREIIATIAVPQEDEVQRITLSLGETALIEESIPEEPATEGGGLPLWLTLILTLLFIGGVVFGFLWWRKRNMQNSTYTGTDPLEADNYAQPMPSTPIHPEPEPSATPPVPVTIPETMTVPEPNYQEVKNPNLPHHATLPELVGRYGTKQAATDQATLPAPNANPTESSAVNSQSPADVSPSGQHIPHHSSLKELVKGPSQTPSDLKPSVDDLPASPVHETTKKSGTKETVLKPQTSNEDGSLTITH